MADVRKRLSEILGQYKAPRRPAAPAKRATVPELAARGRRVMASLQKGEPDTAAWHADQARRSRGASLPVQKPWGGSYDPTNLPLAAHGLNSYRYRGGFGWIMIGAHDKQDALKQAQRRTRDAVVMERLQAWNGSEYVPAASWRESHPAPEPAKRVSAQRLPRELAWDTIEGVKGLVSEIPHYAATRDERSGTYEVIKLEPRQLIARRLRLKDVMPAIRQDAERAIRRAEQAAEYAKRTEDEERARLEAYENNPGFYIVPGETEGPDGTVHNATGPYANFERAGRTIEDWPESNFETEEDVENDAIRTMRRPEGQHQRVKIIEARNAREAAAGVGHVWWDQGNFRGPPVDPRQRGFGF